MTLFVDVTGNPTDVKQDLSAIVGHDGGFGDENVPSDTSVTKITYAKTINGATQNRFSQIVNGTFPNLIVITGVNSTYTLPSGQPVTQLAGVTYVAPLGTEECPDGEPAYNQSKISIIYDTKQCNQAGYHVFAPNGFQIPMRGPEILFHELSHAFHWANRDFNCGAPEFQAISDENLLRAQFGTPLRNANNHNGGCTAPTGYGNPWANACFIVTAAYGSPRSLQVRFLQGLRDLFVRRSVLGESLFVELFAEYYQFSPRIAVEMAGSPPFNALVRGLVVEPLLDVLSLAHLRLGGGADASRLRERAADQLAATSVGLAELGLDVPAIVAVARSARHTLERLAAPTGGGDTRPPAPGALDTLEPSGVIEYLGDVIAAMVPRRTYLAWGLAMPLATYWGALARLARGEASAAELADELGAALDDWLGAVPLPPAFDRLADRELVEALSQLGDFVFTSQSARRHFGARLLARPTTRAPADLERVLRATGFLGPSLDHPGPEGRPSRA